MKNEHIQVIIDHEENFIDSNIRELNQKALKYYEMLENKKNINFRGWGLFFKLYKYEEFIYKMENFLILNIPVLVKMVYKFKK